MTLRNMVLISEGSKDASFMKQDVNGLTFQGYVLEREMLFLASTDFVTQFGVRPKDVKIQESVQASFSTMLPTPSASCASWEGGGHS